MIELLDSGCDLHGYPVIRCVHRGDISLAQCQLSGTTWLGCIEYSQGKTNDMTCLRFAYHTITDGEQLWEDGMRALLLEEPQPSDFIGIIVHG